MTPFLPSAYALSMHVTLVGLARGRGVSPSEARLRVTAKPRNAPQSRPLLQLGTNCSQVGR